MLKHFAALFIVLVFASQTLAGGYACSKSSNDSAVEMDCCAQAKSANSSPVAMLCCQTVCGEPTSGTPGTQSETLTHGQQIPAPPVADIQATSFHLLMAVVSPLSKRSADALLLRLDPPALYLHNSTFLI